jgi:hypothetical protein
MGNLRKIDRLTALASRWAVLIFFAVFAGFFLTDPAHAQEAKSRAFINSIVVKKRLALVISVADTADNSALQDAQSISRVLSSLDYEVHRVAIQPQDQSIFKSQVRTFARLLERQAEPVQAFVYLIALPEVLSAPINGSECGSVNLAATTRMRQLQSCMELNSSVPVTAVFDLRNSIADWELSSSIDGINQLQNEPNFVPFLIASNQSSYLSPTQYLIRTLNLNWHPQNFAQLGLEWKKRSAPFRTRRERLQYPEEAVNYYAWVTPQPKKALLRASNFDLVGSYDPEITITTADLSTEMLSTLNSGFRHLPVGGSSGVSSNGGLTCDSNGECVVEVEPSRGFQLGRRTTPERPRSVPPSRSINPVRRSRLAATTRPTLLSQPQLSAMAWPPPKPSSRVLIPMSLTASVGGNRPTFRDIDTRLKSALYITGYGEVSYYSIPGGFAIAARMERFRSDGAPETTPFRFMPPSRQEPFELGRFIQRLFFAPTGRYRMIILAVTPEPVSFSTAQMSSPQAENLLQQGSIGLPSAVAIRAAPAEIAVTAIIYEFEKGPEDRSVRVINPGSLQATDHLGPSGLLQLLRGAR